MKSWAKKWWLCQVMDLGVVCDTMIDNGFAQRPKVALCCFSHKKETEKHYISSQHTGPLCGFCGPGRVTSSSGTDRVPGSPTCHFTSGTVPGKRGRSVPLIDDLDAEHSVLRRGSSVRPRTRWGPRASDDCHQGPLDE